MLTKHKKTLFVNTNENDVDSEHSPTTPSLLVVQYHEALEMVAFTIHHSSPLYLAVNRGADSIHTII